MFIYSINPHHQLQKHSSLFPTYSHSNIIWLHTDLKRHCWTTGICHSYHRHSLGNCLILCWCEIRFPIKHEHTGTWKITLGLVSNPGLIASLNFNQTEVNSWTGNKPELPTHCSQLRVLQPASRHSAWNNIYFVLLSATVYEFRSILCSFDMHGGVRYMHTLCKPRW